MQCLFSKSFWTSSIKSHGHIWSPSRYLLWLSSIAILRNLAKRIRPVSFPSVFQSAQTVTFVHILRRQCADRIYLNLALYRSVEPIGSWAAGPTPDTMFERNGKIVYYAFLLYKNIFKRVTINFFLLYNTFRTLILDCRMFIIEIKQYTMIRHKASLSLKTFFHLLLVL